MGEASRKCGIRAVLVVGAGMFVSSVPAGARDPDPGMCRPEGTSSVVTAGFPLPSSAVPSIGTVRVAVLFVDFPDAVANHSAEHEADLGLPGIEEYFKPGSSISTSECYTGGYASKMALRGNVGLGG